MNRSDKSSDAPNAKRSKIESEGSASSKPKLKDPFLTLPQDILVKIIGYTPIAQWPSLELVDTNFRAATWIAWRQLRNVNVDRDFMIQPDIEYDPSTFSETITSVDLVLQKLVERSPFLASICGIDIQFVDAELNSAAVHSLAQFEHLQSITVGDAKLFKRNNFLDDGGIYRGIPLENVVEFLESTRSRSSLKEMRLFKIVQREADRPTILDQFASSFVNGREMQLPLKLEKYAFTSADHLLHVRLDTIDTTRLTDVRLGKASIEPDQLTSFIGRASNLRRIDLLFLACRLGCNGPRLEANKKLLRALALHENLTAITFGRSRVAIDFQCTNLGDEFIDMLKWIGRRGQMRKLAIDEFFSCTASIDAGQVCATICDHIPHLRSIKFVGNPNIDNIGSLTELEEICLTNDGQEEPLTANTIYKIAQLPRLKRLVLTGFDSDDKNALARLANATTLTDLRIQFIDVIGAAVFEKWSEELVSKLHILMLSRIEEEDDNSDYKVDHDDDGILRLLKKAVRLRVLILQGRITDRSLMAIAKSCPQLEVSGVRSTSNEITIRGLQEIVDRCPKLMRIGGFEDEIDDQDRNKLQFPKYRKIRNVKINFWKYHVDDDDEYD